MTLRKLSAGTGYEYLTRQVAADDNELGRTRLGDYYAAKGESPGRWIGSGVAGLAGVEPGDLVSAEQMGNLFGTGCHPVTGTALGAAYRVFEHDGVDGFNVEVARRVEALNRTVGRPAKAAAPLVEVARIRTELARERFVAERGREPVSVRELAGAVARYSRPQQTAVAGFDLTFSPVKSVSALWAVAPPAVAAAIEQAHHAAVADALAFIEDRALFTREGRNGARQVETRGLIATAFTHRDSRAGDPDLHTHVAVANKVQTRDGRWLAIYGRVLHQYAVAASETYNTMLERHLVQRLGVRFAERPGASADKRPVREIVGVSPDLCAAWSRRREDIVTRQRSLAAEFTRAHGRPPTTVESVALAQQANLETRQAKHPPRSEAEQRATWQREANGVLGSPEALSAMVRDAFEPVAAEQPAPTAAWVEQTARRVIDELEARRATWQRWHIIAEAQRQIRDVAVPAALVGSVVEQVVGEASRWMVDLTPELDPLAEPVALCRSDGTSVYRHSGHEHYSSRRILDAEHRTIEAAGRDGGVALTADDVDLAMLEAAVEGTRLNPGQVQLVHRLATSGRQVEVALAPAGTGKTTAMRVLCEAWRQSGREVVGLAPSAAAAAALAEATGMRCETLAKLTHDLACGSPSALTSAIVAGTLVMVDEAGMADTPTLDHVISHALGCGAAVRLIGDDRQLAAIGAGGVLRDIARQHGAVRLDEAVRFDDPVEAEATMALRDGDLSAIGFYLDNGRIHVGDVESSVSGVFDAWRLERAAGRDCLMLAPTRGLVADLNARARTDRCAGIPATNEVGLADGNRASLGDVVITRRNDRRLSLGGTDWVKNGDRWQVTGVVGGSLAVRHLTSGLSTSLPADYVLRHVELGYASTVHTAQGVTSDVVHGLVTGTEDRPLLYTMLTRGRAENHLHLISDAEAAGEPDQFVLPGVVEQLTAAEALRRVLARDGEAISASTVAADARRPEALLHDAVTRYDDAVRLAARRCCGPSADDEVDAAAGAGPLPWLPGIPPSVVEQPQWLDYLEARACRVSELARRVAEASAEAEPVWAARNHDILTPRLRADLAVWRAAGGVADDDVRLLGELGDSTTPAGRHGRDLARQVGERRTDAVRAWETRVIAFIGRPDESTTDLAVTLDSLQRRGHDVGRLLRRALARGPLPEEHTSAALDYRLRAEIRRAARVVRKATKPVEPRPVPSRRASRPELGI
ncbi:hypothetical protein JCM18899A_10220 [Nocardioides sp. AN3]